MGLRPGEADYREGAFCRLEDARRLYDQERWVGAVYVAGRAVEALFRSLLWTRGRDQEVGHDLHLLLRRTRSLGFVTDADKIILDRINDIAVIWDNKLRFIGDKAFRRHLQDLGRIKRVSGRRIEGDPLKANALSVLEACEAVIARGKLVWKRLQKS